jgi:hypothetical protein
LIAVLPHLRDSQLARQSRPLKGECSANPLAAQFQAGRHEITSLAAPVFEDSIFSYYCLNTFLEGRFTQPSKLRYSWWNAAHFLEGIKFVDRQMLGFNKLLGKLYTDSWDTR